MRDGCLENCLTAPSFLGKRRKVDKDSLGFLDYVSFAKRLVS